MVLFFALPVYGQENENHNENTNDNSPENTSIEKDPREWGEPVNGIVFTIWSHKSEYAIGEPIFVLEQMKNVGIQDYSFATFASHLSYVGLFEICDLEIKYDNSGKEFKINALMFDGLKTAEDVPLTLRGKIGARRHARDMHGSSLSPGQSFCIFHGWMNLWYDMSRAGEYSIVATFRIRHDGEWKYAKSNELKIKVIDTREITYTKDDFKEYLEQERKKWHKSALDLYLEKQNGDDDSLGHIGGR